MIQHWASISHPRVISHMPNSIIQTKVNKSISFAITYVKTKNKVVEPTRKQAAAETGINAPGFILSSRPVHTHQSIIPTDTFVSMYTNPCPLSFLDRPNPGERIIQKKHIQ